MPRAKPNLICSIKLQLSEVLVLDLTVTLYGTRTIVMEIYMSERRDSEILNIFKVKGISMDIYSAFLFPECLDSFVLKTCLAHIENGMIEGHTELQGNPDTSKI